MRFRLIVVGAFMGVMILSACGEEPRTTTTPGPVGTVGGPVQTAPAAQATTQPEAPGPNPTTGGEATEPAAGMDDGPLALQPVVVETNDATRTGALAQERTLNLPPGFHARVYAAGLGKPRMMGLSPEGLVYVTTIGDGKVVTLPDADKDGVADEVKTFAEGLPGVHGIDFKDGAVYVATEGEIIRLEDTDGDGVADKRDVLASDLPTGGGHSTRTIAFGPDGKLYVSAGSSCNVCVEEDPKRAAISLYSAEGQFEKVYAKGLRNAVGMEFHAETKELWVTNNGRDNIGDDLPPETIYNVKEGVDYGWPYCYGQQIPDESQGGTEERCANTASPDVEMQAHSAPLGLGFYTGEAFPEQLRGDMFVGFHGSWNRSVPTGYKVVRIRFEGNQPNKDAGDLLVEDFATGWLVEGDAWGRPVDVLTAPDGSLLVTDDRANVVYSIYYQENAGP